MKLKIGLLILMCIFGFGFLNLSLKKQNLNLDVETQKLVFENENIETNLKIENECTESTETPFFELSDDERSTVCYIVAGEAKGESMTGKMAVAQCLLNAMVKEQKTAEEIRVEYSYSGWDSELEKSDIKAWEDVKEAVSRVFDSGEIVSENPILFFYAPSIVTSKWHESLNFDSEIGGHRFFYADEDVNANWFLDLMS